MCQNLIPLIAALPVLCVDPGLLVNRSFGNFLLSPLLVLLPNHLVCLVELAYIRKQIHLLRLDELGPVPQLPSDEDQEEDRQTDVVGEESTPGERVQERSPTFEEHDDRSKDDGNVRSVRLAR